MAITSRSLWWARIKAEQGGGAAGEEVALDADVYAAPNPTIARLRRAQEMPFVIFAGITPVPGTDFPFYFRQGKRERLAVWNREVEEERGVVAAIKGTTSFFPLTLATLPPPTELLFMSKSLHPTLPNWKWLEEKRWKIAGNRREGSATFLQATPATEYSATVCGMFGEIQRHLLETTIDDGATWSLWTLSEVVGIFNERVRRFVMETSILQKRATLSISSGTTELSLPEDLIDLRRVSFREGSTRSPLTRIDSWASDNGIVGWESASGTPYAYQISPRDPLTLRVLPAPSSSGELDLVYVYAPEEVEELSPCVAFPIPSIFSPYIKYGVMADMLSKEGQANDPLRAAYCEERYKEGVEIAKLLYEGGQ